MFRLTNWSRRRRRLAGAPAASRPDRRRLRPEVRALEGRQLLSTFEVTTTAGDGSPGSLAYELSEAEGSAGAATIEFDPKVFDTPQTITLQGGELFLSSNVPITIVGPGFSLLTVSAGGNSRVLQDFYTEASISGMTLTDGNSGGGDLDGSYGSGGAFCNDGGDVTLTDVVISDSSAQDSGGGVCNFAGNLDMVDCTVTGNTTTFGGGGVVNYATMEMTGCTVSDNSAPNPYDINGIPSGGGGLFNGRSFYAPYSVGQLTLTDCTISGNTATLSGGGLANAQGKVSLEGCLIEGNSSYDFFTPSGGRVEGGGVFNDDQMTVANCTFQGNSAAFGGGLGNVGTLGVTGSTFSENLSYSGGGMWTRYGSSTLDDCTFSGNQAYGYGGGVAGFESVITGSTFAGNQANSYGGGVFGYDLTLVNCVIDGNNAQDGGGVDDTVDLIECSITDNSAVNGGGVDSYHSDLTDCTIAGNTATNGGGVYVDIAQNPTLLVACTISGNSASAGGGGVYGQVYNSVAGSQSNAYSQTLLDDTIVAGNAGSDLGGGNFSGSDNLIGTGGSGGLVDGVDGNLVGVANPGLAPLGYYGGSTEVMPLLPGSRAIDAGNNALDVDDQGHPLTTDQRGLPRVVNGTVDIGAFESSGFTISVTSGNHQSTTVNTAFPAPLAVTVTPVHPGDPVAGGTLTFNAPASGASATLSASTVTLDANGNASIAATANGIPGSYAVTASSAGIEQPASIDLTNTPTKVVAVSVQWGTSGSSTLLTTADGLRLLPAGRNNDLPWMNIHTIMITLGADVTLSPGDVIVTGASGGNYGPVTISRSGDIYSITLAKPVNAADRLTLTIDSPSIATYTKELDILPGDVNDDGMVNSQDAVLVRNAYLGLGSVEIPLVFLDVNGDGGIDVNDYNAVRQRIGTHLP